MNEFAGGKIKNKLQIHSADSQQFLDRFLTDTQKEVSSNPDQILFVFLIDSYLVLSWIKNKNKYKILINDKNEKDQRKNSKYIFYPPCPHFLYAAEYIWEDNDTKMKGKL